ncbi:MAG: hypothetical protein RIC55_18395 [Pirellulaceae bacterium]
MRRSLHASTPPSRSFPPLLAIAVAAVALAIVGPEWIESPLASADPYVTRFAVGGPEDEEEIVLEWYNPDTGNGWLEVYYKDGSVVYYFGNPGPDSPAPQKGDFGMRVDLAKQAGGGMAGPSWQETPLGAILEGAGKAIGPYYNPADDDGEGGVSPSNGISFKTPQDLAEEAFAGAGGFGGVNLDGNGGSLGGQLGALIRRGKKGNDHGDDDKPQGGNFFDESMPGPPELVNPAWSAQDWQAYGEILQMLEELEVAD